MPSLEAPAKGEPLPWVLEMLVHLTPELIRDLQGMQFRNSDVVQEREKRYYTLGAQPRNIEQSLEFAGLVRDHLALDAIAAEDVHTAQTLIDKVGCAATAITALRAAHYIIPERIRALDDRQQAMVIDQSGHMHMCDQQLAKDQEWVEYIELLNRFNDILAHIVYGTRLEGDVHLIG